MKTQSKRTTRRARPAGSAPPRAASAPVRAGSHRSSVLPTLVVVVLIAAAAAFAYRTSFAGVFVFDDEYAVQRNPNIRTLWPLTTAMSSPPETPVSARPVASLTLALNYALAPAAARDVLVPGGPGAPADTTSRFLENVWGYHFMNLALHVLAALALFGLVRRTLLTDRLGPRFGAASRPLAAAVALLWVVHPLTADAVTYITQRTEVLLGLFYLLTVYYAIRAAEPGVSREWRWIWRVAAVAACALGMGSKQTMVTAPLVVLAWDWVFRKEPLRWRFYAALAATSLIVIVGLMVERWPHSVGVAREGWTPWTYLLTQAGVVVHYLRLAFAPWPLVLDYDGWPMARSIVDVAPQAALLVALVALTVAGLVRRSAWAFAGAWFFAVLAPSSSILPLVNEVAAERRMYAALPAVIALVVIGGYFLFLFVASGLRRVRPSQNVASGFSRTRIRLKPDSTKIAALGLAAVLVAAGGLATLTADRNRDFWSEEGIWRDTVEKRPDSPRARLNYGVVLAAAHRYAEAEVQLRESLRLKEPVAKAHLNLGSILCAQQRFDQGVPHLERAVALDPELPTSHANLAEAYASMGRRADAARQFALAVEGEPNRVFLLNRLGWLLATSPEDNVRNAAKAIEVAERAVSLTGRQDPESLDTLAAAYAEAGRFQEAAATAREALQRAAGRPPADPGLPHRLSLYESGQKYRERDH